MLPGVNADVEKDASRGTQLSEFMVILLKIIQAILQIIKSICSRQIMIKLLTLHFLITHVEKHMIII
tara:strand:+ start:242 stop:442 length:201 start_codon:yes stop_codon:yes gene_type:complete